MYAIDHTTTVARRAAVNGHPAVMLRPGETADATACGRICYEAFKALADWHGFPPDFPSAGAASGLLAMLFGHPGFHSVVAERDGEIAGSNFLDERSAVFGVGPISVDPAMQRGGIGRLLMEHVLDRAQQRGATGVRLLQSAYNNQSLCLYTKLGFKTREPISLMSGVPPEVQIPGYEVRRARAADLRACNDLCVAVHGFARAGELQDAISAETAMVVERQGRIAGYATDIGFMAHAVGETDDDLMALIGAAKGIAGPGILVPTRNHALFSWCLENGLQLSFQMTLMSIGLYGKPEGAYLPSVLY
jgi:GNAT superfamily N-acetyltransferase